MVCMLFSIHSFLAFMAPDLDLPRTLYQPSTGPALLIADGVHIVGARHVGPQALGCFIGHLHPILQDRYRKPLETAGHAG